MKPVDLIAEVDTRRDRLAWNVGELSHRMTPQNLLHEGIDHVRELALEEARKIGRHAAELATDVGHESLAWANRNRRLLAGGVLATAVGGWLIARTRLGSARKPVPLYAAYDMEDPSIMNDETEQSTWNRVREEAAHIGAKAGETYYAARSRAASLADSASGYADDAANVAREAAQQAKASASDARAWTKRQSQEHPVGMILAGMALGALVAAVLPTGRRGGSSSNPKAVKDAGEFTRGAVAGAVAHAKHTYERAGKKLNQADLSPESLRAQLQNLATRAADVVEEASHNAADKLRKL